MPSFYRTVLKIYMHVTFSGFEILTPDFYGSTWFAIYKNGIMILSLIYVQKHSTFDGQKS